MFPQTPCAGAVPQWHLPRPHAVFWGVGTEDLDPARGTDGLTGLGGHQNGSRTESLPGGLCCCFFVSM